MKTRTLDSEGRATKKTRGKLKRPSLPNTKKPNPLRNYPKPRKFRGLLISYETADLSSLNSALEAKPSTSPSLV